MLFHVNFIGRRPVESDRYFRNEFEIATADDDVFPLHLFDAIKMIMTAKKKIDFVDGFGQSPVVRHSHVGQRDDKIATLQTEKIKILRQSYCKFR